MDNADMVQPFAWYPHEKEHLPLRHTPGPWHVGHCTNVTGWCVRAADDALLAIIAASTVETKAEEHYNAEVMAAAAEMLDALEELVVACSKIVVETPETLNMAQKCLQAQRAIDKARGRIE